MNKHTAELLERHFDIAFAAPDGFKKLRELILTLAMQGKLVPQDPNEQPASELLKEIEAEKQRLVKEGKIKKPKPLPPVTEEEEPYSLPQGWGWIRLGGLLDFEYGDNLPERKRTNSGEFPVYGSNGIVGSHSKAFVNTQCIVIGRKGSAGALNLCLADGCCVTDVAYYCIPPQQIDLTFCFRLLHTLKLDSLGKGIKPGLNRNEAYVLVIAVPPRKEQLRIVAKIDELMACCDELEKLRTAQKEARLTVHAAAIKQLLNIAEPDQHEHAQAFLAEHFGELYTVKENVAELRKAILQLAVMGKLVPQNPDDQPASELLRKINAVKRTLEEKEGLRTSAAPFVSQSEELYGKPEGWSYCRLGNIGKFIDYRGKTPTKVETGVPLITAKNVRFGYINREPKEYVTPEEYIRWMTRGFPRVGDILFTTEAPLGNVAIIDIEERFALAQRVICLQLHMPGIASWLKNFMMSDSFQERLLLEATGMTATGIKASKLKEMPVPIPPLEEQYRIVAKVDQVMALCDSLDQQIDAAATKQAELLGAVIAQV